MHLFKRLNFNGRDLKKYDVTSLIQLTKKDKKARLQSVNYILLKKLGQAYQTNTSYAHPVSDEIVYQAFTQLKGLE